MSEQLAPGIKVVRQQSPVRTIQGTGTSIGAFEGLAEKGPIGEATLITSWSNFVSIFGSYVSYSFLAHDVYGFFLNGGKVCYVVRTSHYSDITTGTLDPAYNVKATSTAKDKLGVDTLRIDAINEGYWANYSTTDGIRCVLSQDGPFDGTSYFTLDVYYKGDKVEAHTYLSMDDTDITNYVENRINGVSTYVTVTDLDSSSTAPNDIPADQNCDLSGGKYCYDPDTGTLTITDNDYIGDSAGACGLYAFDGVDEINMVAIPGVVGTLASVQKAIITYCEARSANADGVFGFCDCPDNYSVQQVTDWRKTYLSSEYAALHYPWVRINDVRTGQLLYVPNSGYVMGRYAAVSRTPGVYQAAAGIEYGDLSGILEVRTEVGDADREILNPAGVDPIIFKEGYGYVVYGVRTMIPTGDFITIPASRYFLYLEESIKKGSEWAVFRPINERTMRMVELSIRTFLYNEWKTTEAIAGSTEEEAFYVTCDDSNNPDSSRDLGKLYVDIGVRFAPPAELIEIRIGMWKGGSSVQILKKDQISSYT